MHLLHSTVMYPLNWMHFPQMCYRHVLAMKSRKYGHVGIFPGKKQERKDRELIEQALKAIS